MPSTGIPLYTSQEKASLLKTLVGDDGFGGEEVAEGAEVGKVEDVGEAVVEGLASGAVCHGGETLEFGCGEFVEEAGEGLKLGGREAARFFSWSVSAMMSAMRRATRL